MEQKQEYKVLSPVSVSAKANAKDAKIGAVVKLTDTQAKNRVNKVQLLSDWEAEQERSSENSDEAAARKDAEREKLQQEIADRKEALAREIAEGQQRVEDAKTGSGDPEPTGDGDTTDDENPTY